MIEYQLDYEPAGPTLAAFHASRARRRFIMGPLGSGKTIGVINEIFDLICEIPPCADGVRRSRWVAIRNTYPDLINTTIKDWREVVGDELGRFRFVTPPVHELDFTLEDGTRVQAEMIFLALDRPDDIRKLRGTQYTGGWLNETKELPFAVVQMLFSRVGRYPRRQDVPEYWSGIVGDTNAPDEDHWYYQLAEEERPEGWAFFRQPGGVVRAGEGWAPNPEAENLQNLPPDYYMQQVAGNRADWIAVNLANEYGFVRDGKPIYPEFVDSIHVATEPLPALPGRPIVIGIDFGLTPAAGFWQRDVVGRWRKLHELVSRDMGAVRFAELLHADMQGKFPGHEFDVWADPAGDDRAQTDERTPIQILRAKGVPAKPAPTNDYVQRREAVAVALGRLIDGKPGLVISPTCKVTRKGMAGAYCYKRIQVAGDERFKDKPDKNEYSHICEADQYALLGAGEGRALLRSHQAAGGTVQVSQDWSPFD